MNSQNENEARAVERAEPVAWVEYAENGNARMWSGKLETWEVLSDFDNRPKNPKPLYSQETIDRLTGEVASERQLRLRAEGLCSAWITRHDHALEYLNEVIAERNEANARAEAAERRVTDLESISEQLYQAAFFAQPFVAYAANNANEPRLAKECEQAVSEAINRYRNLTQPEADHG